MHGTFGGGFDQRRFAPNQKHHTNVYAVPLHFIRTLVIYFIEILYFYSVQLEFALSLKLRPPDKLQILSSVRVLMHLRQIIVVTPAVTRPVQPKSSRLRKEEGFVCDETAQLLAKKTYFV